MVAAQTERAEAAEGAHGAVLDLRAAVVDDDVGERVEQLCDAVSALDPSDVARLDAALAPPAPVADDEALDDALLVTINGIAAGMQKSG